MKAEAKRILRRSPLYYPARNWLDRRRQIQAGREWERLGRPVPPPHLVKQETLRLYARQHGLRVLVETGTYYGDMIQAMRRDFDHIYSIELSEELFERAQKRFKGLRSVTLIHGDSGIALKSIVESLGQPALFWLDGHYSGGETARGVHDTPIYEELRHIFNSSVKGHVIVIDDAHCFGTHPGYPTIDEIKDRVASHGGKFDMLVKDDSIRLTPQKA